MVEFIFTLDYEIFGNGEGSLNELVYLPTEKLIAIFKEFRSRFVAFVEVAELEMITAAGVDSAVDLVNAQLRTLHEDGFELGLHIHPQWYNAHFTKGAWHLDYCEYNLCMLQRERIAEIIDRAFTYFMKISGVSSKTPTSFRAGNWLFQPSQELAAMLAERGIKVDSSVFKGGRQRQHHLDYRGAPKNAYYWRFKDAVQSPDTEGVLLELPVFTQMVPFWKMITTKRVGLQRKSPLAGFPMRGKFDRIWDFARFRYPLKLDFCRLTTNELGKMIDNIVLEDQESPTLYKPIVAIGHTKDLIETETIAAFLSYLRQNRIPVVTLEEAYRKCEG